MEKFRLLTPNDIECKVKQINEKGAVILLYKTARTDMDILDEAVGAENWDCSYEEIKGNLYCNIGIFFENRWVYKQDCGIESREDDEGNQKKGEASDAFKRAGFKWGIGRELYTAPFIWIPAAKINYAPGPKPRTYDRFAVTRIEYNDRRISTLAIRNESTGLDVFFWTSDRPAGAIPVCGECGKALDGYKAKDGTWVSAGEQEKYTVNTFGKPLCVDCMKFEINRRKAMEKLNEAAQ